MVQLMVACVAVLAVTTGQLRADIIPYGLQSDVTQATVDSWGWTEIHRSGATSTDSEAAIVAAATGDYLFMGVWNTQEQVYKILGGGETNAVTAITYQDFTGDDNGNYNPNWSNGLNFYRTATHGSWGFTTNSVTNLDSADEFLANGLQSAHGNVEGTLSKGLSFRTMSGNLTSGWAYNVTGNTMTGLLLDDYQQRVFFTANAAVVPEPSTYAGLLGITCVSLLAYGVRRKRQQAA
tara:strand:+ start:140 stop:847 length:708 start_codon:yes stop_codon:yes gene_type:complete